MTKPLFEERADRTLDKVRAVYAQRGGEYADTWRTCRFLAFKSVAKRLGLAIPDEYCRILTSAGFYDMKYERLGGGYKDDSIIDALAYGAYMADEMDEIDEAVRRDEVKAVIMGNHPARMAKADKPEQQYRMLEVGETIQEGDEHKGSMGAWSPAAFTVGAKVRNVGNFRRPINPQETAIR